MKNIKNDWDVIIGGVVPIFTFIIIYMLNLLKVLSGWVGLGVFAFSLWICMILSIIGFISSIVRGYGVLNFRNFWFTPAILFFIFTIGINGLENIFN